MSGLCVLASGGGEIIKGKGETLGEGEGNLHSKERGGVKMEVIGKGVLHSVTVRSPVLLEPDIFTLSDKHNPKKCPKQNLNIKIA